MKYKPENIVRGLAVFFLALTWILCGLGWAIRKPVLVRAGAATLVATLVIAFSPLVMFAIFAVIEKLNKDKPNQ